MLDEQGERLMSLSSRLSGAPDEAYLALSTADAKFPEVTLSTGETVTMSYGQYRAVLATNRNQADRRAAFLAHYGTYAANLNTYATLYHGVCQRDWFHARVARLRDDARRGAARQQHPALGRRQPDRGDARRRRAAAPLSPAAPPRAEARTLLPVRLLDPASSSGIAATTTTTCSSRSSTPVAPLGAGLSGADVARIPRALDRRLRERRQAQRRVLRAGVRRASVHAA